MPPITATAIGALLSDPAPTPKAAGSIARMMVSDVIRMGRKRIGQASFKDCSMLLPSARRWLVRSTSRMEFLATRPINNTRPIIENMFSV